MTCGADVTTLAATIEVGFNPNVAMSLRSACHVGHKRTIAAGVILNAPSAPIASTMMRSWSTRSSLPGRGIARARRHLREQARDGQDGGITAIRDKAPRIDVRTFSDKRCRRRMPITEALPPVGRMRRIDRGAAGADDIFRLDRKFRTVMGMVFAVDGEGLHGTGLLKVGKMGDPSDSGHS